MRAYRKESNQRNNPPTNQGNRNLQSPQRRRMSRSPDISNSPQEPIHARHTTSHNSRRPQPEPNNLDPAKKPIHPHTADVGVSSNRRPEDNRDGQYSGHRDDVEGVTSQGGEIEKSLIHSSQTISQPFAPAPAPAGTTGATSSRAGAGIRIIIQRTRSSRHMSGTTSNKTRFLGRRSTSRPQNRRSICGTSTICPCPCRSGRGGLALAPPSSSRLGMLFSGQG